MVFKKPGNGRDDKSGRSSTRTNKGDDRPKRASSPRGNSAQGSSQPDKNKPKKYSDEKPERRGSSSAGGKPYAGKSDGGFKSSFTGGEKKSFSPRKPYSGRPADGDARGGSSSRSKPYSGRVTSDDRPARAAGSRDNSEAPREKKPYSEPRKKSYSGRPTSDDRPKAPSRTAGDGENTPKPRERSGERKYGSAPRTGGPDNYRDKKRQESFGGEKDFKSSTSKPKYDKITPARDVPAKTLRGRKEKDKDAGLIRLNRYIANAGICSRRKADDLISAGVVAVNGKVVNELGYKIDPMKDEIRYNGELLKREKMVYVLLNKPKDYITTTDDPQERRTVMHLVEKASRERIYPIGRLDRNTTGLLLMTNDGDLADKLSHPRSNIVKLYQVELSKPLIKGDLNKIAFGIELEDGLIKPDSISYVQGASKREIGIQIHSGKNRIVRRIFESLGYDVVKLDRVVYAGLTKKDLTRGRWRYLDEKEVIQLKHLI
jgi:23S rRNA pseudouridine2605 synthase